MSLALFYLPPEQWGHEVRLEGQEARHLSQVLRLGPGSEVGLLDGQGRLGRFVVGKAGKKNVDLERVDEKILPQPEARAIVALAFSKAVRRGFFMEKAVELGASGVWLWQGDHSQGSLSASVQEACLGQLIAGAKQCGNPWLPDVKILKGGVEDLAKHAANADYRILPWEAQDDVPMLSPNMAGQPGLTVYVIGPEGGFSARELHTLRASGFTAVSLGTRVLRCETAATLCLGIHWWASQLPKTSLPGTAHS
ncbi:MAG: 16S rRNA (uracil(1498)-N(3))-methyltransferase [Desulfovibrio sp.]|uniref:16S rRNA (uracil(1498)-N(3))-methyltransferase n=1 Tax=Desulfovibrio sp. TaxID=885 RepID=UPI0039E5CF48